MNRPLQAACDVLLADQIGKRLWAVLARDDLIFAGSFRRCNVRVVRGEAVHTRLCFRRSGLALTYKLKFVRASPDLRETAPPVADERLRNYARVVTLISMPLTRLLRPAAGVER